MPLVTCSSVDPALRNFGLARVTVDLDTLAIAVLDLKLVETEKRTTKQVRQNSDDLRRAREVSDDFRAFVTGTTVCFGEIPVGSQSSRAMAAFGIAIGILANCPVPLFEVQPFETKLATVGTRTASKEDMIYWASELYPDAPWIRGTRKRKGGAVEKNAILDCNEHLADAIAIAHAGVKTEQFKQLMAMLRATAAAAAA